MPSQLDPTRFNVWLQVGKLASDEVAIRCRDPAYHFLALDRVAADRRPASFQLSRALDLAGHHPEAVRAHDEGLRLSNDRTAAGAGGQVPFRRAVLNLALHYQDHINEDGRIVRNGAWLSCCRAT